MATEEVTVRVPEDRLAEFYAFFGAWVEAKPGHFLVVPDPTTPAPTAKWTDQDKALFERLLSRLGPTPLGVLSVLYMAEREALTWDVLAIKAGLGTQAAVAVALGEIQSKSVGHGRPSIVEGGSNSERPRAQCAPQAKVCLTRRR